MFSNSSINNTFALAPCLVTGYAPSQQALDLLEEDGRKIFAENMTWDILGNEFPAINELSGIDDPTQFVDKLNELTYTDKMMLSQKLSTDLSLKLAVPFIDDEAYWERRYKSKYDPDYPPKRRYLDWKSHYLIRHVRDLLEHAEPQYKDETTFDEILELCSQYVICVQAKQLQMWKVPKTMEKNMIPKKKPLTNIEFGPILRKLWGAVELDLVYAMRNVGDKFTRDMFTTSPEDLAKLGQDICEHTIIRVLKIRRSRIGHFHIQAILREIISAEFIEELDLSNCHIGNSATLCVAYFLSQSRLLRVLNLKNNDISKSGGEGMGYGMMNGNCRTLEVLNLDLNPLRADGALGVMTGVVHCDILKKLSLAGCFLDDTAPMQVCHMLRLSRSLDYVDVSSNWFGKELGKHLVIAVSRNPILKWLDLRDTGISEEHLHQINQYLFDNRHSDYQDAGMN